MTRPAPDDLFAHLDEVLAHLEAGDLVLLLDFDGTLAPIVDHATRARPLPGARRAVARLVAAGCRVAVISGRSLSDVRSRLDLEGIHYAGNHGLEIEGPGMRRVHEEARERTGELTDVRERLSERLAGIPGAWIEDKGLTLSVHYREAPSESWDAVERTVRDVVVADALEVRPGKRVWEVRPRVDWDKGRAVEFLLDAWGLSAAWPVYIGDDETDEDAFRAIRAHGGLGVRVTRGTDLKTRAGALVGGPERVEEFLERLAEAATNR